MNWGIATRTGRITFDRHTPTPPPPPGADADTTAWIAAVVTAGGSVSGDNTTGRQKLVNDLIVGLKADGIWTKLDRLWIYAAENSQSALIDLKALDQSSAVGSPTFTTDRGYAGNASSSYINTTYVVSTDAVNYTSSSMHVGIWDNTSRAADNSIITGFYDGGSNLTDLFIYTSLAGPGPLLRPNFVLGTNGTAGSSQGFFLAQQISSTAAEIYYNGSSVGTGGSSAAIVAGSNGFYIGGRNDNGTLAGGTTDQVSMASFGGKFSSVEAGKYYTRLRTYMTGVGVP